MDRNQLEQEAIRQLNLGSLEGALRAYMQIVRLDPRDRRIRQKIGEIYLKLGRPQDAEKQLREVAEGLVKEGSHRAAVAVLKQLIALNGDDPALHVDLAECYVSSGYGNDARTHFDTAMRLAIGMGKPLDAAKSARRLAELSPGEAPLRLKVAELLEAGGDTNGAANVYQEVADEYRRRGRPDEVGRIAEMALRLRPDDVGLLLDSAAARVEANEHKRALVHLQLAFTQAPREPRTLDLLARALEGVGQPDKALKVLIELGRVAADRGDAAAEADALRRAVKLAPGDGELQGRLALAEERVSRMERRLTQLVLAQPSTDAEVRVQVRAEVYLRYGFADRAEDTLRAGLEAQPDALCLFAALAEVEVARGRRDEALRWMERILPRAGSEAPQVLDRMAVLRGNAAPRGDVPSSEPLEAETLEGANVEAMPVDRAPALTAPSPAAIESAEARGDRLMAASDLPGAMMAFREALGENPLNDGVLAKIAALRDRVRAQAAPPPAPPPPTPAPVDDEAAFEDFAPLDDGTFSEINPDTLDEIEPAVDVEEARSLVAVGMWADALALLDGVPTLDAAVLRAQAIRGTGDVARAMDVLRDATNDALEDDPAYCDALFELSALYTVTGKARAAMRLLEEIKDLDGSFRTVDVDARMRGLQKLLK